MLTLDEVRAALAQSDAGWTAGETAASQLPDDEFRRRLGAVPGPHDPTLQEREWAARVNAASPMARALPPGAAPAHPVRWDWRNVDGRNFVTPVRNQGGCGACTAFATVSTLEAQLSIDLQDPDLEVDCSEAHLHFCHARLSCEAGMWPPQALDAIRDRGIADERCYPYAARDQDCGVCGDQATRLTFITSYRRYITTASMKGWISSVGPLIACFTVYDDFRFLGGDVYRHVTGPQLGGHSVSVIGYDDENGCWICKNSWGPGSGNQDFFRIAYGECGIDAEMWTVEGPRAWGPPDDAAFVQQSAPPAAVAGQPFTTTVIMRNTGVQTWTPGRGYRLISQQPEGNMTWGVADVAVPAAVAPWTDATFRLALTAPANPAHLQWRMFRQGSGSFGAVTPDIVPASGSATIRFGAVIKLRHQVTGCALHSHSPVYTHPGTSGQQQITCFAGADDNDLWLLNGPHGQNPTEVYGRPVRHGDVIRLEHLGTGRNLHSHPNIPSPVTAQQEVTGYGRRGVGDTNDNWRVEFDGGGTWTGDRIIRLIHVGTGAALHSHAGHADPTWTSGQQEVTGFAGRDGNDFWYASDLRGNDARYLAQSVPANVFAGQAQQVTVTMVNTGTTAWSPSHGYWLGSQGPTDNQQWGLNRVALPGPVPPGEPVTMPFSITAPGGLPRCPFQWQMVQDGVAWFGDPSPRTEIPIFAPGTDVVVVPAVLGSPPAAAGQAIRDAGLRPTFTGAAGSYTEVDDQSPRAGASVARGSTVRLHVVRLN